MTDRILLFVPCYNCAPQIGRVLRQLTGRAGRRVAEVLVLDNGSSDGTLERATEAAATIASPPITIARNLENFNLGGSHKAAFDYALAGGFSHVLILHGDDQGALDDIAPLLERGDHRRFEACLGARFMRGSRVQGYSPFRQLGNRVCNLIFSAVSGTRVHDLGSGLNVIARPVFADPAIRRASDDLRFNIYLLLGMIDRGARITYFPISWREDDQISNVRLVSQALSTLGIARDYLLRRRHFRQADHRDCKHADYTFDILARSGVHG